MNAGELTFWEAAWKIRKRLRLDERSDFSVERSMHALPFALYLEDLRLCPPMWRDQALAALRRWRRRTEGFE